jgi:hypothetical protein
VVTMAVHLLRLVQGVPFALQRDGCSSHHGCALVATSRAHSIRVAARRLQSSPSVHWLRLGVAGRDRTLVRCSGHHGCALVATHAEQSDGAAQPGKLQCSPWLCSGCDTEESFFVALDQVAVVTMAVQWLPCACLTQFSTDQRCSGRLGCAVGCDFIATRHYKQFKEVAVPS